MSGQRFTAGPWEWWTSNSVRRLSAGRGDGNVVHAYRCGDGVADISISDADMRLIAAAPDLLKALQTAFLYVNDILIADHPDWQEIHSAIAKALGE